LCRTTNTREDTGGCCFTNLTQNQLGFAIQLILKSDAAPSFYQAE